MKVIKQGKIPKFTGECQLCSCVIEADYKEFLNAGYGEKRMIAGCPTEGCGSTISLYPIRDKQPFGSSKAKHVMECDLADEDFGLEEEEI